jgi:hypothetical protein
MHIVGPCQAYFRCKNGPSSREIQQQRAKEFANTLICLFNFTDARVEGPTDIEALTAPDDPERQSLSLDATFRSILPPFEHLLHDRLAERMLHVPQKRERPYREKLHFQCRLPCWQPDTQDNASTGSTHVIHCYWCLPLQNDAQAGHKSSQVPRRAWNFQCVYNAIDSQLQVDTSMDDTSDFGASQTGGLHLFTTPT